MLHDTLDITSMQIMDKRQVDGVSTRMEPELFKKGFNDLIRLGFDIKEVVTDENSTVAKYMRKYPINTKNEQTKNINL
jgi:hypothetical protein